ncbi:MAG: ubiquinone/menaquinone biosynthesis methyltransferase [Polyangia bacterium]|jgi:ubiquinone/menaquinone biosynthesis methyltransferase
MFDRIAKRYDRANRVMSAGTDRAWRRKAIALLLEGEGETPTILDLGAGTLDGSIQLLRSRPRARLFAADFARNMLMQGKRKPGSAGIAVQVADGHGLPYRTGAFDLAWSSFCVRNLRDLAGAMAELRRVLRPGGRLGVLEFFRPPARRWFWDGCYNARVLPWLGRLVTGDSAAYRYLPASIAGFQSRSEFEHLLAQVGFAQVRGRDLFPAGLASLVVAQ